MGGGKMRMCRSVDVWMFQRVKCRQILRILSADVTGKVRRCWCWKSIPFCLLSYSSGVRTDCYEVMWYRARPVCDNWGVWQTDGQIFFNSIHSTIRSITSIGLWSAMSYLAVRGGATVLKVGGTILRAERTKIFFDPPLFGQWGGQNIA